MKFRLIAALLLAAACIYAQDQSPEQIIPNTQASSAQVNRIINYLFGLVEQRIKDPTTTAGDLFYRGGSGLTRLPNPGSTGTFCPHWDAIALVYTWDSNCGGGGGGGGTPAGTPGQIQFNNSGSFAGFTVGGDGTLDTSTGSLVVTKTNGSSFSPSATTDATAAGNITSGTLPAARLPAFSGDVTTSAGATVTTLATVNSNTGACGDATHVCTVTLDGKGRATAASATAISAPNAAPSFAADTSASATHYQVCPSGSPGLVDGFSFWISFNQTNSGGADLAYCGGGAITLKTGQQATLSSSFIPITPERMFLSYHASGTPWWETHPLLAVSTTAQAQAGFDNTSAMSPLKVLQSINQNAPCTSMGTFAQDCGNTSGTNMIAHEPYVNPASGRVFRLAIASGIGTLQSYGITMTATNCSYTDVAVTGPNNPEQLKCTATGAGTAGNAISHASTSMIWAGTSPKLHVGVQFSHTVNVSWMVALVTDSIKASTAQLSYTSGNYGAALVGFRYNPAAGDTHINCVSAPDGATTPTKVDTGLSADTNPRNLGIFVDDTNSTIHFYNAGTEIAACAAGAWGGALPTGVALTPYIGIYQTAGFSGNSNEAIAYVSLSANQ